MKNQKRTTGQRTTGPRTVRARRETAAMPNSVKRGAFDRMKKIFGLLQDGRYPNCTSLATEFEISLKAAARDIEFMRDRWNLPIGYDDQRYGFFFTAKVERLPWVPVTEAELSPPQSAGVGKCRELRIIGTCPAPVAGLADITEHYANCFGLPPAGRRIFLRASTVVSGLESRSREFRARVPAP